MTKVGIVVVNWKQPDLTVDSVNSLLRCRSLGFQIKLFLVDNGSGDNSAALFRRHYSKNKTVNLIFSSSNLGYVEGFNLGIRQAQKTSCDFILLANNDIQADPKFLSLLVKKAIASPKLGILGPKIYFSPGREYHSDRYQPRDRGRVIWSAGGHLDWQNIIGSNIGIDEVDQGQYDHPAVAPDFISGCVVLIRSAVFNQIGLLDPSYFMYLEDADFCRRAILAGWQIEFVPQSVIWHINAGSSQTGSPLHDYFLTRNRFLFGFRYASFRPKFALLRQAVKILISPPSAWQRQAVIDFFLGRLGKGSWK